MTTWICDDCGAEWELPDGTQPVNCPECGSLEFKEKDPDHPGGLKPIIRPGG